ncbi:MFS transporter [Granulicella mallensis]|uniref:Major facilitator superfamily MFS_1 n=1 Tax=Granulicella mallensis (strain ATCC BAA-1857 / DSM 23137 / MP5ACTX8) TaxID=682795 RepID=G8NUE9_GRAMM|nr:MFS transporter [Granulicella mallensis]AEU35305.1 major facilitator superfamily MFS_1 [Granulicella mallensis MP5ACTX8]
MTAWIKLPESKKTRAVGRTRWWIVWTLFFSTAINYISRQTFSVLSPVIAAQYHLSHTDLAKIIGAFQISYALTWLVGGIFLDAVGTRIGLIVAVIWWSLVNMMMGFAGSVFSFMALRFMLGIGEGLNWPGASKTVAEWFPSQERSVAVAIFDSGSSVGGALAAMVIPWIAIEFGWRWSFIFSGLLGFLWLIAWLFVYHPLDRHPRVGQPELDLIRAGQEMPSKSQEQGLQRWLRLAKNRNVWAIVLGRALTDPIWWFYVFWLPQYLSDVRGFSLKQIAYFAWLPFVAADLGNFTGGFLSGYCIRRGLSIVRARTAVCLVSCLPILAGIPAARAHNPYVALALICVALWGYAGWATMGLTLPSDLFPQDVVATVTGLSGLAAGIAGVCFTAVVGLTIDRFSYTPAFFIAGLMPLVATACLLLLLRSPASEISAQTEVNLNAL